MHSSIKTTALTPPDTPQDTPPVTLPPLSWLSGQTHLTCGWQSQAGWTPPKQALEVDDTLKADTAFRMISQGQGLVWRGDYEHAKHLLHALKRRLNQRNRIDPQLPLPERFNRMRLMRSQTARMLGQLILRVKPGFVLPYKRAPDINPACQTAYLDKPHLIEQSFALPLTELVGVLSAHQWYLKGLWVDSLGAHIYPRHGVFAPTRHEYLTLIQQAPLPQGCQTAWDIGTGTGVIAAVLARKGVAHVLATEWFQPALQCAQHNIESLGMQNQVTVRQANLFASGQADLVVCNPPWLPGKCHTPLEAAIYDPNSQMLKGFLLNVSKHLTPQGQAWLVLSDLAEHVMLRSRQTLLDWFTQGGLKVLERHDIRPNHDRAHPAQDDPIAWERSQEVTSLWRLSAERP